MLARRLTIAKLDLTVVIADQTLVADRSAFEIIGKISCDAGTVFVTLHELDVLRDSSQPIELILPLVQLAVRRQHEFPVGEQLKQHRAELAAKLDHEHLAGQ